MGTSSAGCPTGPRFASCRLPPQSSQEVLPLAEGLKFVPKQTGSANEFVTANPGTVQGEKPRPDWRSALLALSWIENANLDFGPHKGDD
jgi:hypothetical protein